MFKFATIISIVLLASFASAEFWGPGLENEDLLNLNSKEHTENVQPSQVEDQEKQYFWGNGLDSVEEFMHEHDHAHEFHSHDEEDHVHVHDHTPETKYHAQETGTECVNHLHTPVWHDFEDEAFEPLSDLTYIEQMDNYRNQALRNELLAAEWKPIRVKYDYSHITGFDHSIVNFVKQDLMEPTRHAFEQMLKVKRNPNGVKSSQDKCYQVQGIPGGTNEPNYDLVIYVTMAYSNQGFTAWATSCSRDEGSLRPNIGQININKKYLKTAASQQGEGYSWMIGLENQISTMLHELTHVLGFSKYMYNTYQTAQLTTVESGSVFGSKGTGSSASYFIKSPGVLALGREWFGCATLEGVGLENQGGSGTAGSHWERSELGDETMTGARINERRYSQFTMTLLKDTGWYEPNFAMKDEFTWGKDQGCSFINEKCQSSTQFKDFCYNAQSSNCDADGSIKTYCGVGSYSNNCKYWLDWGNGHMTPNSGKKCFVLQKGAVTKSKGLEYNCLSNDKLEVTYKQWSSSPGKKFTCTNSQTHDIELDGWKLNCPQSIKKYCSPRQRRIAESIAYKEIVGNGMEAESCQDDDVCLGHRPGMTGKKCAENTELCNGEYSTSMGRCCKKTCNIGCEHQAPEEPGNCEDSNGCLAHEMQEAGATCQAASVEACGASNIQIKSQMLKCCKQTCSVQCQDNGDGPAEPCKDNNLCLNNKASWATGSCEDNHSQCGVENRKADMQKCCKKTCGIQCPKKKYPPAPDCTDSNACLNSHPLFTGTTCEASKNECALNGGNKNKNMHKCCKKTCNMGCPVPPPPESPACTDNDVCLRHFLGDLFPNIQCHNNGHMCTGSRQQHFHRCCKKSCDIQCPPPPVCNDEGTACLQERGGWGAWTCEEAKAYCSVGGKWQEDTNHCCKKTCNLCGEGAKTCETGKFQCKTSNKCIRGSYLCDGSTAVGNANWGPDCPDGSDENVEMCCKLGKYDAAYCPGTKPKCPTGKWACDNGQCIKASYFCDGTRLTGKSWGPDCTDKSDEKNSVCCANGKYKKKYC